MDKPEVDIFRDTSVRLLGYANEVGEAFRPLIHVNWVRLSYGISSAYVLADTVSRTLKVKKKHHENEKEKRYDMMSTAADTLIWQSFASIIIPGFTINRICAASLYILRKSTKLPSTTRKGITTVIGLACIPFIFKPIDHFVDFAMDNTTRRVIKPKE